MGESEIIHRLKLLRRKHDLQPFFSGSAALPVVGFPHGQLQ
jgi:hypothetical protein